MNRKGNKEHPFPKQTAHCVITTKKDVIYSKSAFCYTICKWLPILKLINVRKEMFPSNTHVDASYFADDASLNTDNADTGVDLYFATMSLCRRLLQ